MGRVTDFDHYEVGADLDIASWDSYPLGFLEEALEDNDDWKARFYTQGDPDFQAFHHDLYRAVGRGRWWVMEQQPGPVNWGCVESYSKGGDGAIMDVGGFCPRRRGRILLSLATGGGLPKNKCTRDYCAVMARTRRVWQR